MLSRSSGAWSVSYTHLLLGRIITQQLTAPDGAILAQQGQVVDEALIDAATRAQRRVALTVHSRPAQEA